MPAFPLFALPVAILALTPPRGDRRGEIDLGDATRIAVTPKGDLWVGSSEGHLYVSHDLARTWSASDRSNDPSGVAAVLPSVTAVEFFDDHRGIALTEANRRTELVLRTDDGGQSWKPSSLGRSFMGTVIHALGDGHVWISGPNGLLRSDDWGESWTVARDASGGEGWVSAIDFPSASRGVIAVDQSVLLTQDSGTTWRTIGVPEKPVESTRREVDPDEVVIDGIGPVALVGSRIVIRESFMLPGFEQDDEVLVGSLADDPHWQLLSVGSSPVRTFCRTADGLAALTEDGRVAILSSDLKPLRVVAPHLTPEHAPVTFRELSSSGDQVVAFDGTSHVGVVEKEGIRVEHLFTADSDPSVPIKKVVSTGPGHRLGVSDHFLYGSAGSELRWARLAELPAPRMSLYPTMSGNGLLIGRPGILLWQEKAQAFIRQAESDHFYQAGELHSGDLWLLYGMTAPDEHHADIWTCTTDTVLAGEGYTGVVYASGDAGDSWTELDRWPGGRIEAVDLETGGRLALYRAGGGVRRGPLDLRNPSHPEVAMETLVQPAPPWEERSDWPYVQYAINLKFEDALHGTITGGMFFGGQRAFETEDGGKTWRRIDTLGEGSDPRNGPRYRSPRDR